MDGVDSGRVDSGRGLALPARSTHGAPQSQPLSWLLIALGGLLAFFQLVLRRGHRFFLKLQARGTKFSATEFMQ